MSSGASSAADAAPAGTTQPLALRLVGRGSLAGAALVLAIALAYAVVLPGIARALSEPTPPLVVAIGGDATVAVSEDWTVTEGAPGYTTLAQSGAVLVISEPHPAEQHPAQTIEAVIDEWVAQGPGEIAVLPSPRAFETDAGDDAVTVALQDPLRSGQAWVVSNGSSEVVALLTTPQAGWESTSASAQLVLRSLVFPEEPA
ncbi:hypothetical protein [Demequina mangrovi]|uniref:Type VII secretion-associated protein, Rv3446c family, C-terminal domain-containing protein n=1 Tax=Demequina mangrovi TaxID=1043493 RepID=A0A1H7AIP2_9MICO|nr:hypothetical protein [Demequina mangrovi]SEJ61780.1 hypothetical protein SAMN05421637_2421 [Demequina mangrovi]